LSRFLGGIDLFGKVVYLKIISGVEASVMKCKALQRLCEHTVLQAQEADGTITWATGVASRRHGFAKAKSRRALFIGSYTGHDPKTA